MNIQDRFKKITTFILDIDGVLTDGSVLLLDNGHQARTMNIKDGYALQLAVKKGYRLAVISGADMPPALERLNKLGIMEVKFSVTDKKKVIEDFILKYNLKTEEILFMGDDMPDLPAFSAVGISACPADAVNEVRQVCRFVSAYNGGKGCVREVIEIVLKLNDHWGHESGIVSR
jgi:3-deoxy-D-manno-octulosonate 8-phosphate phosphatase (KDO 8-P phosphatase)